MADGIQSSTLLVSLTEKGSGQFPIGFSLLAAVVVGADNLYFANLKKLDMLSCRQGSVLESRTLATLATGLKKLEELVNPVSACPSYTCTPS